MLTSVDIPDALYTESAALAASRGATVEQLIVQAVAREVQASEGVYDREVELPVIPSKRPGTLDLSQFNFDDLLT